MYQIDNSTAAAAQPASTPAGSAGFFTDGNPAGGVAATIVPAEWLNAVMMELVNVVTAGGLTPTKNAFNQVLTAIKAIGKQHVVLADTGAANAYAAANVPALVAGSWVDGVVQFVKISNANTGASTYSPDGLAAIPIFGLGLSALQGGELRANCVAALVKATVPGVNSGNPVCVLIQCYGAPLQIAPATQSQHAMQLGQAVGRLIGVRVFTSNGTYTPTAGTNSVVVEMVGGGGGGGGSFATGGGQISAAGGGGSGSYARGRFTSGFSGVTMTIGAGGAAGAAGNAGRSGGTTSFGALMSAPGGLGGAVGANAAAPPYIQFSTNGGSTPSGANINGAGGSVGEPSLAIAVASFKSGGGGASYFGPGGAALATASTNGNASPSNGGGGGGGATGSGVGAGNSGGAGGVGQIVVFEFA